MRLTQIAEDFTGGTSYDRTLDVVRSPAGQIASATGSNDNYAWAGHYAVNRGYTANGLNQYTAVGAITPTYDTRGNLTSAGSTTYGYSSENMLTSASGGVTLSYDPSNRLYETVGASTTRMAYDGDEMIAEYNSSNTLQRRYVWGPGTDEPLVWYEGTGTSTRIFYHTDERGSVIALSNSSGALTDINTYDEYGIPGTNAGRFQYTGQQWLSDLGMYDYRARTYSPTLGRFLQTDPSGFDGGMNLHAYVFDDPVNQTDPLGLNGCGLPDRMGGPIAVCGCHHGLTFIAGRCVRRTDEAGDPATRPDRGPPRVPCNVTLQQARHSGRVSYWGVTASAHLAIGASIVHGSFSTASGIQGQFTTIAFGFGAGVRLGTTGGSFVNLASFMGGNDYWSVSVAGAEYGRSTDLDGNHAGTSGGFGVGPNLARPLANLLAGLGRLANPLAALSTNVQAGFSNTDLTNVTCLRGH